MFNPFKSGKKSILGVDISSAAVKILEISGGIDHYQVQAFASASLPPFAVEGNKIKDPEAVSETIKLVLNQDEFTTANVAVAVPDSIVISKVIQLNKGLSDDEIEELVYIEADKFIPYAIDEINMDFVVLGPSRNPELVDVLVIASRSENLDTRVEVLTAAGLNVQIVDVESYTVERAIHLMAQELPAHGLDKIIAVVDIGANYTHLFVLHGMKIIFSREEEFGGKQLIESMAEHYGLSFEKALKAKQNGEVLEGYEAELGASFKESVLLQVKRTLQFFYSTGNHGFVDYLLLAGGVSREEGLLDLLQKHIGIPMKLVDFFSHMSFKKSVNQEQLLKNSPSLMIACGLALRRLE